MFGLNTEEIHSTIKVYHLPGNHDIGYATLQSHKPEVFTRVNIKNEVYAFRTRHDFVPALLFASCAWNDCDMEKKELKQEKD